MNVKFCFIFSFLIVFLMSMNVKSQVVINGTDRPTSYVLLKLATLAVDDVGATKNGGLRLPQLTSAEIASMESSWSSDPSEAQGITVFNVTEGKINTWNGSLWIKY